MSISQLVAEWNSIQKPSGLIADIGDASEAWFEYGDVENYFSGKSWDQIDPENDDIRYMCPLLWMNAESAKYYSLSFLVYLASDRAKETEYEAPNMAVGYFESEFSIFPELTKKQRELAEKILQLYKEHEARNM